VPTKGGSFLSRLKETEGNGKRGEKETKWIGALTIRCSWLLPLPLRSPKPKNEAVEQSDKREDLTLGGWRLGKMLPQVTARE
jgi:hypothetical protein